MPTNEFVDYCEQQILNQQTEEYFLSDFSDGTIQREYQKRMNDGFDEEQYEEKLDDYVDDTPRKIKDFKTEVLLHALKFRGIKRYVDKNNDPRMNQDFTNETLPDDKYGLMVSDRYDNHLDDYFEDTNDYVYLIQLYTQNVDDDYTYFKVKPFTEKTNDTFDKIKRWKKSKFCSGCEDLLMGIKFYDKETFISRVRDLL